MIVVICKYIFQINTDKKFFIWLFISPRLIQKICALYINYQKKKKKNTQFYNRGQLLCWVILNLFTMTVPWLVVLRSAVLIYTEINKNSIVLIFL